VVPALQGLIAQILGVVQPILGQFGAFVQSTVMPVLTALGNLIAGAVTTALQGLSNLVAGPLNSGARTMNGLFTSAQGILTQVAQIVSSQIAAAFMGLVNLITNTIAPAIQGFVNNVLVTLRDVLGAISNLIQGLIDWLHHLAEAISAIQLPDWAQRHSPSPIEQTFNGWAEGLRDVNALLPQTARALESISPKLPTFEHVTRDAPRYTAPVPVTQPTDEPSDHYLFTEPHPMVAPCPPERQVVIERMNVYPTDFEDFLRELERRTGVQVAMGA